MEREDRVGRQSRGIDSRVRVGRIEFGVFQQPPRAPDRDSGFLVGVMRRDQQRTGRIRRHRAAGRNHGELDLAEGRGNLRQHRKKIRRGLAIRRAEIDRDRNRSDSRARRGFQRNIQRRRAAHLAEKIARAMVAADLLRQHAQQKHLDFGAGDPPGQLEPAHQPPRILCVERAGPPLQRDYVVKEVSLAASGRPANPEHSAMRFLEMLIEDFPRAFGRAGEDVAGDGRDARRRLQLESLNRGRLDLEPAPRAPHFYVRPVHRQRLSQQSAS